jgi:hypothetical protein
MKALKALVIGMGLLIVIGLGLVGYGLFVKGSGVHGEASHRPVSLPGEPAPAGQGYFSVELPVSAGSHLEQMTASGDKLLLRLSGADGERILVLDANTGHLAGTVTLVGQRP